MDRAEPGPIPHVRNAATGQIRENCVPQPKNPKNLRLALIFGAIALFFFLSVFVKRIWLS